MLTIVKFFSNYDSNRTNQILSKTLLKFSHINRNWRPMRGMSYPKHDEFWKVRIVTENKHGTNRGNFLVDPISKVPFEGLTHIPATMFSTRMENGVLIAEPLTEDHTWLLPLDHKKAMAREEGAYAVILNMGGSMWERK